jgi:hypothetical protein
MPSESLIYLTVFGIIKQEDERTAVHCARPYPSLCILWVYELHRLKMVRCFREVSGYVHINAWKIK